MRKAIFEDLEIRIPDTDVPRIVIIGGGFGGLELAKKMVKKKYQVVLFDRNNYHTFQPLLYQVATAGLEPDSIAGPLRQLMKNYINFYFRMARVTGINLSEKSISTVIGSIKYDFLIIANGAKTNFFGNKHIADESFPLKQVPHALDLRSQIFQNFEKAVMVDDEEELKSLMNIVIVGGGPTGVELSGALAELRKNVLPKDYHELDFRKMEIYLIEGQNRLLAGMSEKSAKRALKDLEKFNVRVMLDTIVDDYTNQVVSLNNGNKISSHTLIWAAGVSGNVVEGIPGDLIKGNRISVDEFNQLSGFEDVFAIGDIAYHSTNEYPKGLPMVAQVAIQQADALVRNLDLKIQGKLLKPFKYKNKGMMATIGRNKAVVDLPNGFSFGGRLAWFIWMFVHLVSIIGFRNKLVIFSNWAWSYFTYDRGTRLIIRLFIPDIKARNTSN